MAVGVRALPVQPASPETRSSMTMSRLEISVAMPWKSAGVGAGASVEMRPHATSTSVTATSRATDRRDRTAARLSPGRRSRRAG